MEFTEMLKKNHEFRRLYSRGKSEVTPCIVVYCRPVRGDKLRLGITVSTKVGNAVTRNKVRRRLKEIYRLNEHLLSPGADIVIVARNRAAGTSYKKLEAAFLSACKKLSLLKEAEK